MHFPPVPGETVSGMAGEVGVDAVEQHLPRERCRMSKSRVDVGYWGLPRSHFFFFFLSVFY